MIPVLTSIFISISCWVTCYDTGQVTSLCLHTFSYKIWVIVDIVIKVLWWLAQGLAPCIVSTLWAAECCLRNIQNGMLAGWCLHLGPQMHQWVHLSPTLPWGHRLALLFSAQLKIDKLKTYLWSPLLCCLTHLSLPLKKLVTQSHGLKTTQISMVHNLTSLL